MLIGCAVFTAGGMISPNRFSRRQEIPITAFLNWLHCYLHRSVAVLDFPKAAALMIRPFTLGHRPVTLGDDAFTLALYSYSDFTGNQQIVNCPCVVDNKITFLLLETLG